MREQNRCLERENDQLAEQNGKLDTQLQDLTRKLELYEEQVACARAGLIWPLQLLLQTQRNCPDQLLI